MVVVVVVVVGDAYMCAGGLTSLGSQQGRMTHPVGSSQRVSFIPCGSVLAVHGQYKSLTPWMDLQLDLNPCTRTNGI